MENKDDVMYTSFLGRGWGFPPAFSVSTGGVGMTSDEEDIEKSLEILLSTAPGERILRPDYGCNLEALVFEPLSTTLKTYVQGVIEQAILHFEPRISLEAVDILPVPEGEGRIDIRIDYTVRTTNSRYNFVYPFYSEGEGMM